MTLTQLWVTLYEASTVMEPTLIRKNLLLTDGQSLTHQPTNDNHSPRITVFTNRIQSVYNWKKGHVDTTSLLEEFLFSTVNFSPIFRTLALPLVPTFYIGFGFFISFKKACSKSRLGTRHQSIAKRSRLSWPEFRTCSIPLKKNRIASSVDHHPMTRLVWEQMRLHDFWRSREKIRDRPSSDLTWYKKCSTMKKSCHGLVLSGDGTRVYVKKSTLLPMPLLKIMTNS